MFFKGQIFIHLFIHYIDYIFHDVQRQILVTFLFKLLIFMLSVLYWSHFVITSDHNVFTPQCTIIYFIEPYRGLPTNGMGQKLNTGIAPEPRTSSLERGFHNEWMLLSAHIMGQSFPHDGKWTWGTIEEPLVVCLHCQQTCNTFTCSNVIAFLHIICSASCCVLLF